MASEDNRPDQDFSSSVLDVYEYLLHHQEALGEEFQCVLRDNLWDLYERS